MKNIKLFFIICILPLLTSCAANVVTPKDSAGNSVSVPLANFKLRNVDIIWKDNPSFTWQSTVVSTSPRIAARSRVDMLNALDLLKEHSSTEILTAVADKKIIRGNAQTMQLTPVNGHWSEAGWGYGVAVNVIITDMATASTWTYLLQADTGIHMFGAMSAGPLDRGYVQKFSEGLRATMAQAGLL
jgi:hypothetical protein